MNKLENRTVKLSDIELGPNHRLDELPDISKLMMNIKEIGLLNPVTVAPTDNDEGKPYRLVAGFRRFAAHEKLGWKKIDARVKSGMDATQAKIVNIIENIQRKESSARDQGLAFRDLMENDKLTLKEVAIRVGESENHVRNCLQIVRRLPATLQKDIVFSKVQVPYGKVSATVAARILTASKTHSLTQKMRTDLMGLAKRGLIVTGQIGKAAVLMKKLKNPEAVVDQFKKVRSIYVNTPVYSDEVDKLLKKHKELHLRTLCEKILYGEIKASFKRPTE